MYYSIQDFIENGIANLEECEKSLMKNPLNWTDQILGIQPNSKALIVRVPCIMAYQFNFSILNFSQFHPHCARNPVLHMPP